MAKIEIDTSEPPFVIVRFPRSFDEAELEAFCEAQRQLARTPRRHLMVIDLTVADFQSTSGMRKTAAALQTELEAYSRAYCAGSVQAVRNPVIRGALTAVQWVSRPGYESHIVRTMEEALAWARAKAQQEGLGRKAGA